MSEKGSGDRVGKDPLLVWMPTRSSYVETQGPTTLRIKHASKMGKNLMDFADTPGSLVHLEWDRLVALKPSILEVNGARCPLDTLMDVLDKTPAEKVSSLLDGVRVLSLNDAECSADTLIRLLSKLKLLSSFSVAGGEYTTWEWEKIARALQPLSLRLLSLGCGPAASLINGLNVECLQLAGQPGVNIGDLSAAPGASPTAPFVTVKVLFAQEVDFGENGDERAAEKLLEMIPTSFPRLECLVFDWNMVDPALVADANSERILSKIVALASSLPLSALAIVAYTPCGQTKHAAGQLARFLSSSSAALPNVTLSTFATRGVPADAHNFSILMAGGDGVRRAALTQLIVEKRRSIVTAASALQLVEPGSVLGDEGTIIDFGGFDNKFIRRTYTTADQEE